MTVRLITGEVDAAQVNHALRQLDARIKDVERSAGSGTAPVINIQDLARQVAAFINVGSPPGGSIGSLTFGVPPVAIGTSLSEGASLSPARADHVHIDAQIGCRATIANQSIPDTTPTAFNFDTETLDTDSMHESVTNPSRITFTHGGYYIVGAAAIYNGSATGRRLIRNVTNTGAIITSQSVGGLASGNALSCTTVYQFSAGDWMYVETVQDSGGSLTASVGVGWAWRVA